METRLKAIESDMGEMQKILLTVVTDVAEIKGKISQMPTTMQLWAAVLSSTALAAALVFGAIRVAIP